MVKVSFCANSEGLLIGFEVIGHAGFGVLGEDTVCAAVSSAAYMAVNTITEVLNINAQTKIDEGYMKLILLTKKDAKQAQSILKGFKIHIEGLTEQYPRYVKVKNGGVTKCLK